jgi:hypothetical protein
MACRPTGIWLWNPTCPQKSKHPSWHTIVTTKGRPRRKGQLRGHHSSTTPIHQCGNYLKCPIQRLKESTHATDPWPPDGRTLGSQQNNKKSKEVTVLGRDESVNSELCQRVSNMSAKQDNDTLEKNTPIPYHHWIRDPSLQTSCDGPDHGPPKTQWKRHNSNYCQSWMLKSGGLPSVHDNYHRPRNCPTIHGPHLQMVWTPHKNH